MEPTQLVWIANFIWGIADDVLRALYVRGKYRDVLLPMTVLRRLDAVLEPTKRPASSLSPTRSQGVAREGGRRLTNGYPAETERQACHFPTRAAASTRRAAHQAACSGSTRRRARSSGTSCRPGTSTRRPSRTHQIAGRCGWRTPATHVLSRWNRSTDSGKNDGPDSLT